MARVWKGLQVKALVNRRGIWKMLQDTIHQLRRILWKNTHMISRSKTQGLCVSIRLQLNQDSRATEKRFNKLKNSI